MTPKPSEIWGGWVPESELDRMFNMVRREERERAAEIVRTGGDGIEGVLELAIQLGPNEALARAILANPILTTA